MDYPLPPSTPKATFPWRTVAMAAAGLAALEMLALIVVGGALLAKQVKPSTEASGRVAAAPAAKRSNAPAKAREKAAVRERTRKLAAAELPRPKLRVLVLNGNGRTGAASAAASSVSSRGYKVGAVTNAPRQDYPQSIVLYKRGFQGSGQRLAKDLGIKVVGPLDGISTTRLKGAHLVLILGA